MNRLTLPAYRAATAARYCAPAPPQVLSEVQVRALPALTSVPAATFVLT